MELETVKQEALKVVLKNTELTAEELVEKLYAPMVEALATKIKEVIPGKYDDIVIDLLAPQLAPVGKAALLATIEKLSAEV